MERTLQDNAPISPPPVAGRQPESRADCPISRDSEEARRVARSLARVGRFDEAIECWRQMESLDPFSAEPARMIAALTLKKARQTDRPEGDEEDDVQPTLADDAAPPEKAASLAQQQTSSTAAQPKPPRPLVLTRRQQLEQEIANRPLDESNYLELADLLLAEHRTYEAQRTLIKASEVCRDLRIVERLEDVNMLRAKEQVKLAEERAVSERTQEARDEVERLREESYRLELDVFRNRCHRHPDDKRLKFQLGLRLQQIGSYREALEPLQAGLEFPDLRAAASLEIGEILQRHQQFPKALQCYRQAAQMAAGDDGQQNCRKRALYRAGVLAAAMTLNDTARGYFAELAKMDSDYRDVRTRLDKLGEISDTSRLD